MCVVALDGKFIMETNTERKVFTRKQVAKLISRLKGNYEFIGIYSV